MRSHYPIDSSRLDLAAEFKANPFGPHSPTLQRIVTRMRCGELEVPGGTKSGSYAARLASGEQEDHIPPRVAVLIYAITVSGIFGM